MNPIFQNESYTDLQFTQLIYYNFLQLMQNLDCYFLSLWQTFSLGAYISVCWFTTLHFFRKIQAMDSIEKHHM